MKTGKLILKGTIKLLSPGLIGSGGEVWICIRGDKESFKGRLSLGPCPL